MSFLDCSAGATVGRKVVQKISIETVVFLGVLIAVGLMLLYSAVKSTERATLSRSEAASVEKKNAARKEVQKMAAGGKESAAEEAGGAQ